MIFWAQDMWYLRWQEIPECTQHIIEVALIRFEVALVRFGPALVKLRLALIISGLAQVFIGKQSFYALQDYHRYPPTFILFLFTNHDTLILFMPNKDPYAIVYAQTRPQRTHLPTPDHRLSVKGGYSILSQNYTCGLILFPRDMQVVISRFNHTPPNQPYSPLIGDHEQFQLGSHLRLQMCVNLVPTIGALIQSEFIFPRLNHSINM